MTHTAVLPEELTYLIIRFATSIEDLPVFVRYPRTTTTLSLKQVVRQHLPPDHAFARLRLICAGQVLADTAPLSTSLRLPPPSKAFSTPPKGIAHGEGEHAAGSKSKGKQPMRGGCALEYGRADHIPPDSKRHYVHCSLGDVLPASELAAEASFANEAEIYLRTQRETSQTITSGFDAGMDAPDSEEGQIYHQSPASAVPQAQGFDSLLSAGLSSAEVAALRLQFQTNLSFTHTPENMPSPQEMRVLEDQWLNSSANDSSHSFIGLDGMELEDAGWGAGWGAGFSSDGSGLDDMLWGCMTGFFWPLGALMWGFNEEGLWTGRRQFAVIMGVLVNVTFGLMRWSA